MIVTGSDGRIQGFQEKPDPAEALSDLVNCMVYAFSPELFDYFPRRVPDPVDFANDVFPALLEHDVPFHVHEIDAYWNDIGTLREYLQGNLDAVSTARCRCRGSAGELAEDERAGPVRRRRGRGQGPVRDGCRSATAPPHRPAR